MYYLMLQMIQFGTTKMLCTQNQNIDSQIEHD